MDLFWIFAVSREVLCAIYSTYRVVFLVVAQMSPEKCHANVQHETILL